LHLPEHRHGFRCGFCCEACNGGQATNGRGPS
jgi:hypothetical protein